MLALLKHIVKIQLPISIFLGTEINEIRSHGQPLTVSQLRHAKFCCLMFIRHFIPDTPSHIHNLLRIMISI